MYNIFYFLIQYKKMRRARTSIAAAVAALITMLLLVVCCALIVQLVLRRTSTASVRPNAGNAGTRELVVAWYNEDLSWIDDMIPGDFKVTVYAKLHPSHPKYRVVRLDNVGRDTHTFMHHISTNYDSLAHVTVFTPGCVLSPAYDGLKRKKLQYVLDNIERCESEGTVCLAHNEPGAKIEYDPDFAESEWTSTTPDNENDSSHALAPAPVRPFGQWYKRYIGDEAMIRETGMSYNCCFAASSDSIRRRPVQFYEEMVSHYGSPNDEETHYMERALLSLFKT